MQKRNKRKKATKRNKIFIKIFNLAGFFKFYNFHVPISFFFQEAKFTIRDMKYLSFINNVWANFRGKVRTELLPVF